MRLEAPLRGCFLCLHQNIFIMAIITPSSTVSEIRGSVGSNTYSRNHYRPYVKNRTTPIQPDTAKQISARGSISNLNFAWQALTDEERTTWIKFAADAYSVSRMSERHRLTGYGAFSRAYLAGFYGNGTTSGLPVQNTPIPIANPLSFVPNGQFTTMDFSFIETPSNYGISIFASRPASNGIMSPNSVAFYRMQSFVNNEESFTIDFGQNYLSAFDINLDDWIDYKIFVKVKLNDVNNGTINAIIHGSFIDTF